MNIEDLPGLMRMHEIMRVVLGDNQDMWSPPTDGLYNLRRSEGLAMKIYNYDEKIKN